MHQRQYVQNLLKKYQDQLTKLRKIPMSSTIQLNLPEDDMTEWYHDFKSLIGKLLFLAIRTRPDILYPTILMSQYSNFPTGEHFSELSKILEYLKLKPDEAINLSKVNSENLVAYVDANWGSYTFDKKSISGYLIFLAGVPVSWRCKKQQCVALSSMEAEYVAISEVAKEMTWLKRVLQGCKIFGFEAETPVILTDSQSAIHFAKNNYEKGNSRHIDIRYHFVQDWIEKEILNLVYVKGKKNLADFLKKPLAQEPLAKCLKRIFS